MNAILKSQPPCAVVHFSGREKSFSLGCHVCGMASILKWCGARKAHVISISNMQMILSVRCAQKRFPSTDIFNAKHIIMITHNALKVLNGTQKNLWKWANVLIFKLYTFQIFFLTEEKVGDVSNQNGPWCQKPFLCISSEIESCLFLRTYLLYEKIGKGFRFLFSPHWHPVLQALSTLLMYRVFKVWATTSCTFYCPFFQTEKKVC